MKLRIAVGVVAFGEGEIDEREDARAHRLDMHAETADSAKASLRGMRSYSSIQGCRQEF